MEDQENDLQEVQPDEKEQETDDSESKTDESSEVAKLRAELAEKEKEIADLARIKRENKKALKEKEESESKPKKTKQSGELDYGQKAYLNTKGIDEADHEFVESQLKESGLPLEELLNNGYFKAKLTEVREQRSIAEATPSGTRNASEPAASKADYWIQKGELPPNTPENRQLRQEVVNKRMAIESAKSSFTSQPIVEG